MSRTFSFLDLAEEVLKLEEVRLPLTDIEIWEKAKTKGIAEKVRTKGKTPWRSIGARLGTDIRDNTEGTRFVGVSRRPRRFFLKSREGELTKEIFEKLKVPDSSDEKESQAQARFKERDIHPLLAYFAYSNSALCDGGGIYTKTILHEKSTHGELKEWLHPDMVGAYLPFEDMNEKVIALNKEVGQGSVVRIFSFELKRKLTRGTYRESFFQAVSNSSWAHEGYLVTAAITEDDELYQELTRLTNAFGIGVILLDLEDIDSSEIVFPAKRRTELDWDTISKLYDLNKDFQEFIDSVHDDLKTGKVRSQYDAILDDPDKYIRNKLKIETTN